MYVRKSRSNGKGYESYAIGVPPEVGKKFSGRNWTCELTDDGLLYRPVDEAETKVPAWLEEA